MRLGIFMLLGVLPLPIWALEDFDRLEIQQRIKPVGNVRILQQPQSAGTVKSAQPVVAKKEPGQATYEQYCVVCHRDGLAGAPKFRNTDDWKPRLAARKNVAGLTASAIKGLNAMPAKGTCIDCTTEDLEKAVIYMMPAHE